MFYRVEETFSISKRFFWTKVYATILSESHRAIFVWPWNENTRTKQKQQTNGNRAIWLVYRKGTKERGFWLVNAWKYFMPENFPEFNRYFALTSYRNTIGQPNNAFSTLGILWRENKESMFWSFHPLADKTNNEHFPKPYFKVIRKSLYDQQARETNEAEMES